MKSYQRFIVASTGDCLFAKYSRERRRGEERRGKGKKPVNVSVSQSRKKKKKSKPEHESQLAGEEKKNKLREKIAS